MSPLSLDRPFIHRYSSVVVRLAALHVHMMNWLRFRLSATLLASTYRQQASFLSVRAFAGLGGGGGGVSRFSRYHHQHRASRHVMSVSSSGSAGGAGGGGKQGSNRLAGETSPYLLQHAHNPVDWMPWGPEAFAKAKEEDKPIFLSIGYSTCHWYVCNGVAV